MAEEIKFEKAMERLTKLVEELESGDVALEEAIKKYEEGVKLAKTCQNQLRRAEQKIEVLTKSLEGDFATRAFNEDEAGSDASSEVKTRKKNSKKSSQASDSEGELL